MLVVGGTPEAQKKARLIGQENEAVVVSATALYEELFAAIRPFMPGDPPVLIIRAIDELENHIADVYQRYAPESGLPRVPQQFIDGTVPELADFINIVQTTVRLSQNKPILAEVARVVALKEAVRLSYEDEPVAIVVTGIQRPDLQEFQDCFFPGQPYVIVDLDKNKNVESAMKSAGAKLAQQMGVKEPKEEPQEPRDEVVAEGQE